MTRTCGMRCIAREDRTDQGRVCTLKRRGSGIRYLSFSKFYIDNFYENT